jgi:TRAP-type transport system periplasmic protein
MKGTRIIHVFVVLFFAVACMFTTVGFAQAQDKTITLRFSDQQPATSPIATAADQWCKEVEKRTNGKVKVRYYPGATLNSPLQMYESVLQGVIDIGSHFLGYTQGRFPLAQLLYDCPFEYPSATAAAKVASEFYLKFKPKEFDDTKVLYFHSSPPPILLARKPVNGLADLKGMKIRTMGQNAKIMAQFGAAAVGMPMPEVYDALSKGIVDGITNPYTAMKEYKLIDVTKYALEYKGPSFLGLAVVAMNKNKWNSIPPDSQKIIEAVSREWLVKHGAAWDNLEKEAKDYAISKGAKIAKLSAEENAKWASTAETVFQEMVAATKQKNLPGDEVVKFAKDTLKQYR